MIKIAIITETHPGERRVAATPDMVKKYLGLGAQVSLQAGAGLASAQPDHAYEAAGASVVPTAQEALSNAQYVLKVAPPTPEEITLLPPGSTLLGMLDPFGHRDLLPRYETQQITALALELLPRISRAQAMDVLSSQSNLAGYRAVIEAAQSFGKVLPMMMTAAGTVPAAKALILGAGVAGLQAIATAKRLGAIVSAFDVRRAAKEQVESLGAKFIEVPTDETGDAAGGYAKEMSEEYKRRQSALIAETLTKQDLVVTTALIPGKPAPVLITEEMVRGMKPGSVIVDLAAGSGGNCALTVPDQIVERHGVTLVGYSNLPSRTAVDASALYARNLYHFVSTLLLPEPRWSDELVTGTLLTRDGKIVHSLFL